MEAMASGLPSVCRRDLCIKDTLIDDYNGYQYDNFPSFRDRVNQILATPELAAEMSVHAKEIIKKEYSTVAFAQKMEAIYQTEVERLK